MRVFLWLLICAVGCAGCVAPAPRPSGGSVVVATAPPRPAAVSAVPGPPPPPTATLAVPSATPTRLPMPTTVPTATASRTAGVVPSPSPTPRPATPTALPAATPAPTFPASPAGPTGPPLVAIDPGHGGDEIGAVYTGGGLVLREKDVNLAIAQRLAALLKGVGYRVVLTRQGDSGVNLAGADLSGDGQVDTLDDLQARIDKANAAGAQLLFSIHNNGSASSGESGSEVYYCPERPYAERNLALARLLEGAFVQRLAATGYRPRERGVKADTAFRYYDGRPYCASLLGPVQLPRRPRASQMPAALGESLFLSNPEGALLARADVQQAIAQAYFDAASGYFALFPVGS